MSGRALNSVKYVSRPPASAPAARAAWDIFLEAETRPAPTYRYGNMGEAGCVTSGPDAPPRNRRPVGMVRTFADYWIWLMEFDDGDFEEVECRFVTQRLRRSKTAPVT